MPEGPSLADRFVLADQTLDGEWRFLARNGSLTAKWGEACLFWTAHGARDAVAWHDLQHMRVLPAAVAYQVAVPEALHV